jgi:hypothetical protein
VNGVSCIPDTDRISAVDVAQESFVFCLRRCHKMKATVPTTNSRTVTAPTIAFDTDGFRVVVVLMCIVCTGILYQELLISHGIRDTRKTDFRASGANIAPCAGLMRNTMTLSWLARLKFGSISPGHSRDV